MTKRVASLVVTLSIAVCAGCGSSSSEPAKSTPEPDAEQKAAMEKAMSGGGGPEMLKKMQEQGKTTKPE